MTNFKEELEKKGLLVYTNVGTSMMPLLRERRDIMVIRAVSEPLCKNDVVLFLRDNGQYILHRITKIYPDRYFIVGDHCIEGETVRPDQILGILTEIRRDGKTILMTDKAYRRYVRTVPFRRFLLRQKARIWPILHKIKCAIRGNRT